MIKTTPDMIVSASAVGWSVLLPFLPDPFFTLIDGMVGVLVLLVVALLALPQGPVPGVLTLIAVGLTFAERNRRKISVKLIQPEAPSLKTQLQSAPPMSEAEVHPSWEAPTEDESSFYPQEEQTDAFTPVAPSINEKSAIPTISTNEGTAGATRFFTRQHLASTELA
jgi:hypothetical protein